MTQNEHCTQHAAVPELYPIHLSESWAKKLVELHAEDDFHGATRFHGQGTEYRFSAHIEKSGDVELFVSYRSDNGVCLQSGPCLNLRVRPFTEARLAQFKKERMFELAEAEYFRQRRELERVEIARIQQSMFGEDGQ